MNPRKISILYVKGHSAVRQIKSEGYIEISPLSHYRFDLHNCTEYVLIDIFSSFAGSTNCILSANIPTLALGAPLTIGGGIRSMFDAEELLHRFCDRISINSLLHLNGIPILKQLVADFGTQSLLPMIDVVSVGDSFKLLIQGTKEIANLSLQQVFSVYSELGIREVIVRDVDSQGMQIPFNQDLYKLCDSIWPGNLITTGGLAPVASASPFRTHARSVKGV